MNLRRNTITTLEAALTETINAVGAKKLGSALRPRMDPPDAGKWIRRVAQPNRPERLTNDDLITVCAVGRRHGCHAMMWFIESRAGYKKTDPVRRADQVRQLRAARDRAEAQLKQLQEAISRAELDPMTVTLEEFADTGPMGYAE